MDRKLQRHRADSLRQHGFLVHLVTYWQLNYCTILNVTYKTVSARFKWTQDFKLSCMSLACWQDLEMKTLPKAAKLGMQYHIHDLIGADQLDRSAVSHAAWICLFSVRHSTVTV